MASHDYIHRQVLDARAGEDSLFLLNLLCREGRLLAAMNRPLEAEPTLREGLRLSSAAGESLIHRSCLHWLGVALIARGQLQEVLACFEELLRLSQESGDEYHEAYALMGLAYHDWQNDRPREARNKYLRSASLFRELGQVRGELWALTGLNNALTMLGEYEKAVAGNRRIVEVGRRSGLREVEAFGHNNLGVLLFSIGDTGEALDHFRQAADLQERNGNPRESIIAWQNVCICEIIIGRTREASKRLRALLEISREKSYLDVQMSLIGEIAFAHLQRGDFRAAAELFRQALGAPDGLTPKRESEALIGLSAALAGMDSTRAALDILRSSSDRMLALEDPRMRLAYRNEMAERLLDEDLPAEAYEMAMIAEREGAGLGLSAHRLEALPLAAAAALALGAPDSALALLRRGAGLWESERGVPLDPEWREQRGAAAKRLFSQLTRLLLQYPPELPVDERVREAFDALQSYKARTLLERMTGPKGEHVPILRRPAASLDSLQSLILEDGELLLDFAVGPERSILFACNRRERRALLLPDEKELNRKLRLLHELLAARPAEKTPGADIESIDATARNLAGLLFSSCADMIDGAHHLIVAPDGILNLVPFSYLFPDHAVSEVPAAAVLVWSRRNEAAATAPGGRGDILALAGRRSDRGEPLPGAAEEIRMIERRFDRVSTTPRRVAQETFAGFDVMHFAAHSTIDDQSPWRSAIHLGTQSDAADGHTLRASEVAGWKLSARIVVLSSCRSAGGRILSGEGVQGLTAAFLSAGAQSVLATLWSVDDEVTADFMALMYDGLRSGESVSSAVRKAQEAVRGRPRTAHPFYWAGFVLAGDGTVRVSLSPNREARRLWWTAGLVPVIIVIAIAAGRKKSAALR